MYRDLTVVNYKLVTATLSKTRHDRLFADYFLGIIALFPHPPTTSPNSFEFLVGAYDYAACHSTTSFVDYVAWLT